MDKEEKLKLSIIITVGLTILAMLYVNSPWMPNPSTNHANAETVVLVIKVPRSFGEPVAAAASSAGSTSSSVVTIVFERGVVTVQLQRGASYKIVYVDDPGVN